MIIFIVLTIISLIGIIMPIVNLQKYYIFIVMAVSTIMLNVLTLTVARNSNNPDKELFDKLNTQYQFLIKNNDIVPFEVKRDIYDKCFQFNKMLLNNKKYDKNEFIGLYYPEINDSTIVSFDLTKIK